MSHVEIIIMIYIKDIINWAVILPSQTRKKYFAHQTNQREEHNDRLTAYYTQDNFSMINKPSIELKKIIIITKK